MALVVLLLILALGAEAWIIKLLLAEPHRVMVQAERFGMVPRCSHCGSRQRPRMRMIAGRRAYICERCVRRATDLLDSPQDITRFF